MVTTRWLLFAVAATGAGLAVFAAAVDLAVGGVIFPWPFTSACALVNGFFAVYWWRA